jgi:hypothetical protein
MTAKDEVLRVRDGKGQLEHEEEAEGGHRDDRREDRRSPPETQRDSDHRQQEDHDHVGELDRRSEQPAEGGGEDDGREGRDIAGRTASAAGAAFDRADRRALVLLAGQDVDVNTGVGALKPLTHRAEEKLPPTRAVRLADDDLRDVALPSIGDELGGGIGAGS